MSAPGNKVKLIDFDIARVVSPGKSRDTVVMGTEGYAALGLGSGAAEEQLQTLAEKGYDGGISISLWGAGFFKDPDKAMRQCSQWLRECKSTAFGS